MSPSDSITLVLQALLAKKELSEEAFQQTVESFFLAGDQTPTDAQIGAFLFATSSTLPQVYELLGGAKALRKHMTKLPVTPIPGMPMIDTCGTGGSGYNTFNTSTVVAFILAAAGCQVVKHGNRAATSACGSADILEALEIPLDRSREQSANMLRETNFCFCFAPLYHSATKRVQGIRKQLGFRTLFNFLGPLSNPAEVPYQLLGVSQTAMVPTMAAALQHLGVKRALVVCGEDGLDEITLSTPTMAIEVTPEKLHNIELFPEQYGFTRYPIQSLLGASKEQNQKYFLQILEGQASPLLDLVLFNAGAALAVAEKTSSIAEGIAFAREIILSGKAKAKLREIQSFR